jgi:hypothetical protein
MGQVSSDWSFTARGTYLYPVSQPAINIPAMYAGLATVHAMCKLAILDTNELVPWLQNTWRALFSSLLTGVRVLPFLCASVCLLGMRSAYWSVEWRCLHTAATATPQASSVSSLLHSDAPCDACSVVLLCPLPHVYAAAHSLHLLLGLLHRSSRSSWYAPHQRIDSDC